MRGPSRTDQSGRVIDNPQSHLTGAEPSSAEPVFCCLKPEAQPIGPGETAAFAQRWRKPDPTRDRWIDEEGQTDE